MEPTPERFRALARSSPWRWSTLRYVLSTRGDLTRGDQHLRVWLRRPNLLRAEDLDGNLTMVRREEPRTVALLSADGGRRVQLAPAATVVPALDEDGFVRERPPRWEFDDDDPMLHNYYDVAMLDPVELADGREGGPGVTIEDLRAVEHHGRRAWEALVYPTAGYDPRCPCCPLLLSEESFRLEAEAGGATLGDGDPAFEFPEAHRLRLDLATGICVYNEQLGGTRAGWGHDVQIETVDESMDDDLFPSGWPRSRRRSPVWSRARRPFSRRRR